MKKILLFLSASTLLLAASYCQEELSPKEIFEDAEFFYSTKEYEESVYLFQQLVAENPGNFNFNFKTGMALLNIPGRETEAIPYLEKAVENTSLKYRDKKFEQRQAPHHAWFYLGNAYRINNDLDRALETYETFMDIRNFESKYNLRIVENEIKACQRAKIIKDSPVEASEKILDKNINSAIQNSQPVVNPDETVLIYLQKLKFYDAIMCSYRKEGAWSEPVNITPQIGSDGDLIPTGLSPDGRELLLVKDNRFGNKDIYISRLKGEFWSSAEKLPDNINSLKNESHASFSADGSKILFSSDRKGGYGKLDLWVSERKNDGNWGQPVNMGPVINSEEDETGGTLILNDRHLYFTSTAHFNMGGYDVFFSERQGDTWTDPLNLGYPVNTTGDNRYFQPVAEGTAAYVSLFNREENFNEEDIYRIEFKSLAKITLPESLPFRDDFSIELQEPLSGEVITINYDAASNDFKVNSTESKKYKLKLIRK